MHHQYTFYLLMETNCYRHGTNTANKAHTYKTDVYNYTPALTVYGE